MSKRVLKMALGVTAATAAGAGAYAYVYPNEFNKLVHTVKFFNAPQHEDKSKKAPELKPSKAIEIKQPINDESLPNAQPNFSASSPKQVTNHSHAAVVNKKNDGPEKSLRSQQPPAGKSAVNGSPFSAIKPVDVKRAPESTPTQKSAAAEESDSRIKAAEASILAALESTQEVVRRATDAKYKTIQAIQAHVQELKHAVDAGMQGDWSAVNRALERSEIASKADIALEASSRDAIDALRKGIADAKQLPNAKHSRLLLMAGETANKCAYQLDQLNHWAEKARNERRIFNQYRNLIETSRRHFADELKSIVPGMDVSVQQGQLTKEELDALLSHAYLRINQFRQQLVEQQVREEQNIARAVEDQQKADEKSAAAQLDLELRRVRESINFDIEKKVLEERKVWETELESRLQRAAAAHTQHLEDIVRTQKQLHDIENTKLVEVAVTKERSKHAKDVELAMAKLHGIKHALRSRVAMDTENRRAKQYWLASQNLVESIVYGCKAGNSIEARRKPLAEELNVIKEACSNDEFVQSIVNLFPKSAVEQGVFTEQDLRNRYDKIYKIGRRTAKIDENGGSLPKYAISYLQHLLMVEVPRVHSPNDKVNVGANGPDVYDVLGRAKYFVDRGDFSSAVRLVQLLDGQPGRLASDWLVDTRAYLETRFLAQLLAAHATVTSIRSTY